MPNWQTSPIGELCHLINGRAFKPTDWGKEGLRIVRIQNLNDHEKPFNFFSGEYRDSHYIKDGEILLSWSGTPGTSFGCFRWLRGPGLLNQHIFKVLINESVIDGDFFIFAVNSKLDEMISKAHGGVGLRHITKGKLEAIRLPLPSLNEQRRIVGRIKDCLGRVEEISRLRSEAVMEADALLPSMLNNEFLQLAKRYGSAEIGQLAVETRYGTSSKCTTTPNGTAILRIPNVAGGFVNFDDLKYCHLAEYELSKLKLKQGDLLFVRTNGSRELVGRCAIFDSESDTFAFASYLIRVRLEVDRMRPKFLAFFLNSTIGRTELDKRRRTSAGQFNINSENLRSIEVPVPPVDVQDALINKLGSQQKSVIDLRAGLSDIAAEGSHLRDSILRKAFAGEL